MIETSFDKDNFSTRVMRLIITLIARGHRVVENGIGKDDNDVLWFVFPKADVEDDVIAWREGKELKVDLHMMWYAQLIFQCALHGINKDKQIVCTLKTLGHEIAEGGVTKARDDGRVTFQFEGEDHLKDANAFLEMRPMEVDARDFWSANDFFISVRRTLS